MTTRSVISIVLCSLIQACYRTPEASPVPSDTNASTGDRVSTAVAPRSSTIDATELRGTGASSLYDAIVRLRPGYFATRGVASLSGDAPEILVVVDRRILGGVSELRAIATATTKSVRRLSSADVLQITGRWAPAGGIEVILGR